VCKTNFLRNYDCDGGSDEEVRVLDGLPPAIIIKTNNQESARALIDARPNVSN
jgi:hypothetical protein